MVISNNLKLKLDSLINKNPNECTPEYLSVIENIINSDIEDYMLIHSVTVSFNEMECIFIDRVNLKFVTKIYNHVNILDQWEQLKYNPDLYRKVLYAITDRVTKGLVFNYVVGQGYFILINAGPDNFIIVPGFVIKPIVDSIYGTPPQHTLPKIKQANVFSQTPNFELKRDGVDLDNVKENNPHWYSLLKYMWYPHLIEVKICTESNRTIFHIASGIDNKAIDVRVIDDFDHISYRLYNCYKLNNSSIGGLLNATDRGVVKIVLIEPHIFVKNDVAVGALIKITYEKDDKHTTVTGYIKDALLEKHMAKLISNLPKTYTVI